MEWIPYSQFKNVKEIARGGFGIIYQATWLDGSINRDHNAHLYNKSYLFKGYVQLYRKKQ